MTFAVEAEQLVKHYTGRGGDVEAVRGVDLQEQRGEVVVRAVRGVGRHVQSGEVFGFLGPNGAGKSTTVRMLTTLMTITSGSARRARGAVAQATHAAPPPARAGPPERT